MIEYIDVVINVPLDRIFTYKLPENSSPQETAKTLFGRRVEVPFGNRKLQGFIVASYEELPPHTDCPVEKIRRAKRFMEDEQLLTEELFNLALWMKNYYICNIGEAVFCMMNFGKRESETSMFSFDEDSRVFKKQTLSEEQQTAVDGILNSTGSTNFHYLYGMTGSGKTEVFLSAAEKILQQGKGVIYLVPEIGLTPQVTQAVQERFGNTVAVLHSEVTPSQKLNQWKKILNKELRVVIGARSAVFAPVPDLGLIIIDEEHDGSYKSGNTPRYHARQIAMHRCTVNKIPLVMGSATPSVEAFHSIKNKNITCHTLTKRLAGGAMPVIQSVNLSNEVNKEFCLSQTLVKEMNETIKNGRQTILFLNRRGFTHFFRCNSCGYEIKCRNCSVSMTYHKAEKRLRCHYCGYSISPPTECPKCSSLDTGYSGFGTEYIEAEVKARFPNASILRIDTDSLTKKGELQEKLDAFRKGQYDILLGTQMVAKGLNFPNLQLVGVILADTALHLPDFRASEKTFSLITQVAGRAGRYFPDGKVIVQSYSPERDPIAFAVKGETSAFYENELMAREILSFPPYTRLLRLVFRSQVPHQAEVAAHGAHSILCSIMEDGVELLGPAECPLEMVGGNYRFQILIRTKNIKSAQKMVTKLIKGYTAPKNVYIEVDVDPVNML